MFPKWHQQRRAKIVVWHDPEIAANQLLSLVDRPRHEPAGDMLQPGRNTVSRLSISGRDGSVKDGCVKDYGLAHIQPWIYRLRRSKAIRAAVAAQTLSDIGITTPQPLAVLHQKGMCSLRRVMLVTEFWPHQWSLKDLFSQSETIWQPHITAVGKLLAQLHQHHLVHRDNTAGNTIIRLATASEPAQYAVIDINRLRRAVLNDLEACQNLAEIGFRDDQLRCLLAAYRPQADDAWHRWAYHVTMQRHDYLLARLAAKKARRAQRHRQSEPS
ncbi:MAG: hypothetical protein F6K62_24525 [Sphaerospermopsis sp. SIO1G2]|nr:hypothetical protein [Sphaerospermopsis sp. SIO1G2]